MKQTERLPVSTSLMIWTWSIDLLNSQLSILIFKAKMYLLTFPKQFIYVLSKYGTDLVITNIYPLSTLSFKQPSSQLTNCRMHFYTVNSDGGDQSLNH